MRHDRTAAPHSQYSRVTGGGVAAVGVNHCSVVKGGNRKEKIDRLAIRTCWEMKPLLVCDVGVVVLDGGVCWQATQTIVSLTPDS